MLTGKRFRLEQATLGVKASDTGKRCAVTIPAGSIIKVISGSDSNGVLSVQWEARALEMLLVDVNVKGVEIDEPSHSDLSARA